MNILFIGDLREQARSLQRFNNLKALNHNLFSINRNEKSNSIFFPFLSRITNKFLYPLDYNNLNRRVLDLVKKLKNNNIIIDIVWLDKPLTLRKNTLLKLKKIYPNVIIVFNTEDDMTQKHNQSIFFLDSLSLYDYFFTTKSYNLNELKVKNIYFFNNTFDASFHRPINLTEEEYSLFKSDVCFIGSFEKERAKSMLYLANNNVKVRIYGNGWNRFNSHKNLEIMNQPVYGDDLIKVINAAKINLNFLRKINRDMQTNRSVEIPACEAFMLAERTKEHQNLFKEGVEADYFSSDQELLEKVQYYLANEEKRKQIAINARKRCLSSGYDMKSTLKKMISIIKQDHKELL